MILSFVITQAAIFVLSYALIKLVIINAEKLGLQDIPNERSAHTKVVPKGAGVGFVSAVLIGQLLFNSAEIYHHIALYSAVLIVLLIGIYDDKYDVKPRIKFLFLIIAALIIAWKSVHVDTLGEYFGFELQLPFMLSVIFTVFAIVGFANAFNMMDGLDGLAGGLSLIMLTMFFAIGVIHHDEFMVFLSSGFIVAVMAFLIFNWNPAKIFMGDSGSLTLGFIIAVLAIKSSAYLPPAAIPFLIGLPLIDTFIVVRRRLQRGVSPFSPDKTHMHHFLYRTKKHVRFSVMMLLFIQMALSLMGYQMKNTDQFLSLVLFAMIVYVFFNLFDQRSTYRPKKTIRKKEIIK